MPGVSSDFFRNIAKTCPCNFSAVKKMKISSEKKEDIFNISAQNIDRGYTLEPPRRGGSKEYPQSIV